MMNREDTATSHIMSVKDDLRKQEVAKIAKRVSQTGKTAKPTLEIYRPPKTNLRNGGGKVVHFQMTGSIKGTSPTTELKSALKRSKSFGGNDVMETAAVSFERDAFPLEYHGLIRRALHDPNSLSSRQLMELVRLICSKAVESLQNAEHSAQMCFAIIEKENGDTFLESLLNSCREWYNERDKLLRSSFTTSSSTVTTQFGGGSKRWTAYISFLTGLYMRLKSQHHQSVHRQGQPTKNAGDSSGSTSPTPAVTHQTLSLLRLLYECSQIILKPPSLNNVVEIECLRSMLTTVGRQLENDAPQRMQQIVTLLRDAFINPSISSQIRKTILELVELHASQWHLDLPQSMYYFPYTSVDRR